MQKQFEYTFEDESPRSSITFEYTGDGTELVRFGWTGDEYYLSASRTGFLSLAKLFIKIAEGSYREGFHLHLGEDFAGSDSGKTLMIGLIGDSTDHP